MMPVSQLGWRKARGGDQLGEKLGVTHAVNEVTALIAVAQESASD